MLLFKAEHKPLILAGTKTQTRRLWPHGKRVNVGSEQQARLRMLDRGSCFAILAIEAVWQQPLYQISEAQAVAEGYANRDEYMRAFARINHVAIDDVLGQPLWAVAFHVAFAGNPDQRAAQLFADTQGITMERLREMMPDMVGV